MICFVDTSAILALLDADDQHHKAASRAWEKLISDKARLVTSNYVVVEVTALMKRRLGVSSVRAFSENMLPVLRVEWVDRDVHNVCLAALTYGEKAGPSLVDYASFEIMRKLGIRKAFAFDRHFRAQGFERL